MLRLSRGNSWYWQIFYDAARRDLEQSDFEHLRAAYQRARKISERLGEHYCQLGRGFKQFVESRGGPGGLSVVPVGKAIEVRCGLSIKVAPQLGLRCRDGRVEVLYLWPYEEPLAGPAAEVLLYLMWRHRAALHPGATPCVVDVRRSKDYHLPARGLAHVEKYLDVQIELFASLWGAVGGDLAA
ncbi:hypothetical protein [Couchioplanes azureus]|uniref:hypothetical protein n=1 Tax=Couchioplanes caeruleus TaxID=56438 RepID=UPI0016716AAF|nr:hypothetical protein [Couchioplanes caeruleus]